MESKSPISVLDEFSKKKMQPPPTYTFSNDLSTLDFCCTVTSFEETMTARAKSKRKAKQLAALNLIKHFCKLESFKFDVAFLSHAINSENDMNVSSSSNPTKTRKRKSEVDPEHNYVGELLEFCIKNKLPPASFDFMECCGSTNIRMFHVKCRVNNIEMQGDGFSKQEAKRAAAKQVLTEVKSQMNITSCTYTIHITTTTKECLKQENKTEKISDAE